MDILESQHNIEELMPKNYISFSGQVGLDIMDDDFGTKYVTASRRLSITSSVFVLAGLLIWLQLEGLLGEFPVWMLAIIVLWIIYATIQSVKYYRVGYTNYSRPNE